MTISWAVVAAARRAPRGRCRASRAAAATRPTRTRTQMHNDQRQAPPLRVGGVLGGSAPYPEPSPLRQGRVTGLRNPTTPTLLARERRRGRPPGTRLSPLQQGGGRGACLSSTQERAKASALAHLAPRGPGWSSAGPNLARGLGSSSGGGLPPRSLRRGRRSSAPRTTIYRHRAKDFTSAQQPTLQPPGQSSDWLTPAPPYGRRPAPVPSPLSLASRPAVESAEHRFRSVRDLPSPWAVVGRTYGWRP